MIIDRKTIDLHGKLLFETVVIKPPFQKPNPMPNEACFLYIVEGIYDSTSALAQIRVKTDESVLMKCGRYWSDMIPNSGSEKYQAVAVHFFPEVLSKIYENKLPDFLKNDIPPSHDMVKLKGDLLIKKYIESLLFYFEHPQIVDEEILTLKLKEIIVLLNKTKNSGTIRSILSNLFNPSSFTIREVVDAHIYANITVDQLADLTGMSISTFKREFQKVYNDSPGNYIRIKKIEKATDLLQTTSLNATEIAYDCGFSSVSHFSRTFKQIKGLSPSHFRMA